MILVTGGCRSGKSEYGEKRTEALGMHRLYIATGLVFDDEMRRRVDNHKKRRGPLWITHEGYKDLEKIDYAGYDGILLDSVTSMVTNLLFDRIGLDDSQYDRADYGKVEKEILEIFERLTDRIAEEDWPFVCVTDEIGLGMVPETPLGRAFRDILGRVNQLLAAKASEVYFVVSGIPVPIKSETGRKVDGSWIH